MHSLASSWGMHFFWASFDRYLASLAHPTFALREVNLPPIGNS
jgi:hypothetical protein